MNTLELLRQYRLGGYALFDLSLSFLGILLLVPWLTKLMLRLNISMPKKNWLILTLPLSIFIHLLTGQMTQMTKDLFDPSGHYLIKILMIVLLVWGTRGIKKINPS